ncbi:MAG: citrate synthase [Halobacteria archaeon]|nr:citrate synthase [Halobacteria archaeon]
MSTETKVERGLDDVIVDETALSYIDGDEGRLIYRGYDIEDLARGASYEEVLYLLWHGHLPTREELDDFAEKMKEERALPEGVIEALRELAEQDEDPMAVLRTGVSMLSAYDPEPDPEPEDYEIDLHQGRRITAKIPTILAAFDRLRNGKEPIEPRSDLGHAANFLYMLTGEEPDEVASETFDMALILHADHGLNASTFTSIVIVSTFAGVYNAITGGIGALSGPWHGGANQDVMRALIEMDEKGRDPIEWTKEKIESGDRIPGFGHRVYNVKDPRATLLQEKLNELTEKRGDGKWYNYTTSIEDYITQETDFLDKGIAPNVDFYSGSVYHTLGIPLDLYTPIFAMSRVGGWVGHILEYEEDNRLVRPRGKYVGPMDREFVPIDQR